MQTWLRFPVGADYAYDNIGIDLAAYIFQVRAGTPFHEYVREKLLAPLGMTRSSFDLEQVRRDPNRAVGHSWPFASAPFDMAFVGAGGFYTSAAEMAEYIRFHINRGTVGGKQVLDSRLLDTMYAFSSDSSASHGYALGIAHDSIDNIPVLTHNGGGVGFLCDMWWFPDLKLGIILLTNSTDHQLQSKLAPGILADLVQAWTSVYHERLAALQGHFPSQDNLYSPRIISRPSRKVSDLASAPGPADEQRWASYAGLYRIKVWNLVAYVWPFVEKGGYMYLNGIRMEELRPGVFFTPDSEAFDLTGEKPLAWSGMVADRAKNEMTPVKEEIMALCALVLLSALLVPPGVWVANRLRRRFSGSHTRPNGWLTGSALFVSAFTALAGLLFLAAIILYPVLPYQDALALNANLGLEARLMMSLPLGLGVGTLLLVALSIALWIGENVSLFGDQFYFIALPRLVFRMTGSALAFGTILMVAGIPRAVFMLVGGVMTDRLSPRTVMIVSNLLRLVLTILLTLVVAAQAVELWMLYAIAFCFGLVDAFFPAYRAIIPLIVDEHGLQASNSLMQGAAQLVQIIGPGVAGIVVRSVGAALSFAFDAVTFLFTSLLLWMMRPTAILRKPIEPEATSKRARGILAEIGEMLTYIRHDRLLTTLILVVAAVNLLFVGPLIVGSAALGQVRFVQGSAAYGAMLSAFAIGALAGTLTAGAVHLRQAGVISLLLVSAEGVFMVGIGCATSLALACGLWLLTGFGAGFGNGRWMLSKLVRTDCPSVPSLFRRVERLIRPSYVGIADGSKPV